MTLDELQRRDARIAELEALGRRRTRDQDHELACELKRRDDRWAAVPLQIARARRRAAYLTAYARQIGLPFDPSAKELSMTTRISAERVLLDVSAADEPLIAAIAERAQRLDQASRWGRRASLLDWQMDVTACHANGNPLDLQALLDAGDIRFARDVFGIATNLNRATGELMNDFAPLHAARDQRVIDRIAA